MTTISLCMIVKNEAEILERCLDSIADMMDELIIVDTGSDDNTKQIAARYTDKIYDFYWIDDFAAARNFAFAKATCDYIYSADADEVLDAKNRRLFGQLKEDLDGTVEIVQMYYMNQLEHGSVYNFDRELRPKLFKRQRDFFWVDPIHETVRLIPVVQNSEIEIIHRPEASHAARDLRIFEKTIKNGKALSTRLHEMYARELFIVGLDEDFIKAAPYFEKAMQENTDLDRIKEAACVVARAARLAADVPKFFKFALKDIGSEGCSEMCCELGEYYRGQGDFYEAIVWFYNAAFETTSILNIKSSGVIPLLALADCYEAARLPHEAAEYRKLAGEWSA